MQTASPPCDVYWLLTGGAGHLAAADRDALLVAAVMLVEERHGLVPVVSVCRDDGVCYAQYVASSAVQAALTFQGDVLLADGRRVGLRAAQTVDALLEPARGAARRARGRDRGRPY